VNLRWAYALVPPGKVTVYGAVKRDTFRLSPRVDTTTKLP